MTWRKGSWRTFLRDHDTRFYYMCRKRSWHTLVLVIGSAHTQSSLLTAHTQSSLLTASGKRCDESRTMCWDTNYVIRHETPLTNYVLRHETHLCHKSWDATHERTVWWVTNYVLRHQLYNKARDKLLLRSLLFLREREREEEGRERVCVCLRKIFMSFFWGRRSFWENQRWRGREGRREREREREMYVSYYLSSCEK